MTLTLPLISRFASRLLAVGLLALVPTLAVGQVGVGTATPNAKAVLDLSATDKGLLIPRLDSVQRVAISAPPDGLMVFQKNGRVGLWYAFGGAWLYIPDKLKASDNLGSHTATRALTLNNFPLRLRAATDLNHQLEYRSTWLGTALDGPALYGFGGGVLGGGLSTAPTAALRWTGTGQVGIGTLTPAASAQLDVASTTRGFLPPRMTTAQRDAIAAPAEGLTIYNTTADCLESFVNGRWRNYCTPGNCDPATTPGSIVAAIGPICTTADPPVITSVQAPSGGLSPWTFAWQQSVDGGTTWTNIAGATGLTYDPSTPLPVNTQFRRVELNPCGAVQYTNACTVPTVAPLVIGPITGPTVSVLCGAMVGSVLNFSIAPVAGAIGYDVQLPPWLTLVRTIPFATSIRFAIRVDSLANTSIGISAVSAVCGNSVPSTLPVLLETPAIGPITPDRAFCAGTTNVTFSVPDDPNVLNYFWVPGPGTQIVSSARNTAVLNMLPNRTNASFMVRAVNVCGVTTKTQNVSLNSPTRPYAFSGPTSLSRQSQAVYTVIDNPGNPNPPDNYNSTYSWSIIPNTTGLNVSLGNTTGRSVTLIRGNSNVIGGATLTCTVTNPCGSNSTSRFIGMP